MVNVKKRFKNFFVCAVVQGTFANQPNAYFLTTVLNAPSH